MTSARPKAAAVACTTPKVVTSEAEIRASASSWYTYCENNLALAEVKERDLQNVAFVGVPCQITPLRKMEHMDPSFLVRDANNTGARMRPGSYRLDQSRSSIYMPMTQNFPKNTEMEVELTFTQQPGAAAGGGRGGGGDGGFFEGVGSVAASGEATADFTFAAN